MLKHAIYTELIVGFFKARPDAKLRDFLTDALQEDPNEYAPRNGPAVLNYLPPRDECTYLYRLAKPKLYERGISQEELKILFNYMVHFFRNRRRVLNHRLGNLEYIN